MENYKVEIKESSKELSARERISLKDTTNAIRLDEALGEGDVTITPVGYAILGIHNEKADDKDYENYIILDKSGTKYVTGSSSFWSSFIEIYEEMQAENEEYSILAYRVESKNYKGKYFLTCSIL